MFHLNKIILFFALITSVAFGEEYDISTTNRDEEEHFAKAAASPSSQNLTECSTGFHTMQMGARHSQGAGIGYTHGYTTLEGFFSGEHCYYDWTPFLDLRGHMFNNAHYAANAGVGLRYLSGSVAWGINSYYDYRNTNEFHYNQWGLGLEAIGSFWSININGYLPVGKKRSKFFDLGFTGTASQPSFAFFQGNQFFITLSGSQELIAKQEFAFKGVDAKFLLQVMKTGLVSLDAGLGPYYFRGAFGKSAIGGEANLTLRIGEYLALSATGSYDSLFHQRGQAAIGISIPFGPRNFRKNCADAKPCEIPSFFNARLTRGALRDEIIVLDRHEKVLAVATAGGTEVAINPATGEPYAVWFVNNESSSDGTFESPYPTIQEALAVAGPDDMIYVYPGDGSAYDIDVALQEGQFLLGAGTSQNIETTQGVILIPAEAGSLPLLQNSVGATMVTVSDRDTISGFNFNALNAGNIVVATGIDSLYFQNNQFTTAVTTGMNNLAFTDCIGSLLIQNNQFAVDAADTGSFGILLSDAGSGASTLSVLNNIFTNHAARAISLNYSGSSTPVLQIAGNTFAPPPSVLGTTAIDLATSNTTALSGFISNLNNFSGYTQNVINLNWGGAGNHTLAIAGNTLSSDPSITGTNGVSLFTNTSGTSTLTVSNNQFTNQTGTGLQCAAALNADLRLAISGNTLIGTSEPGNNGIQINPSDSAQVTGFITNNTCSEHLGGNINGFPSGSSHLDLTIANNTLSGPSTVPGGSFPNGIQFNGNGSCTMDLTIEQNLLTDHADHGINVFVSDTATVLATVDSNTLIVPDSVTGTAGIQVSAGNSGPVTSTYIVTNNSCTGHTNANIQSFPNEQSILELTISGNILSGPTVTPGGSFPNGIQISANDSASINATINGHNQCTNHNDRGINVFSSSEGAIAALIDGNTIIAPVSTASTSGITVGGNNTSTTPSSSYIITNNVCTGHNNGSIQCFPSQELNCEIIISKNTLTSTENGVSGSGPAGVQISASDNSVIMSATITNNTWRSPNTYDSTGTPQGFSIGGNQTSSISNVLIANNVANLPFTAYQGNTGPSGIQSYLNNDATMSGLKISSNTVNFPTATYVNNSGPGGIQVNAQNNGVLTDVMITNNTVTFAIAQTFFPTFQQGGVSIGGSDAASVGTILSPALITQNTIQHVEGNGITLLNASSNNVYMDTANNYVSLGTVMQNEIGIVTVPIGSGKLVANIHDNTIDGNNGGFIGIAATNQSPVCQTAIVYNNTVSNVHGNNPAFPIPGFGGGMAAAILGSGDLNVFATNNGVSGNTPQGLFGVDSSVLGATGTLAVKLQDNHGVGSLPPDNYTFFNPGGNPLTFIYQNAGGNAGTITFSPSMIDFTAGIVIPCL